MHKLLNRSIIAAAFAILPASAAHAKWYEVTSPHFAVYSEGDPSDLKDYIEKLERYDSAMRLLYKVADPGTSASNKVTVFLVRDAAHAVGMDGILGVYFARASGPIAFATKMGQDDVKGISRIGLQSDDADNLSAQAVLFHEYAHHFMYTAWPDISFPTWFVEGFAEYNGPSIIGKDGSVSIGAPPNYRAWGARSNELPIRDLLKADTAKLDFDQVQALYGRGWLLVHYLMADRDRFQQLNAFLKALMAGTEAIVAAQKAFGDLDALDRNLNTHLNSRIMGTTINAAALTVGEVDVRPLGDAESAVMPALLRSKAGVDSKSAPGVADLAERLAKPFPIDLAAQNELAEAEFDAKRYDAADAAATRALAVDPKSVHALIYRGMADMEIAKRDKVTDPARWKAIRAWFGAANRIDTEYAEPLALYYRSYAAAGEAPTSNAQAGLLYAEVLAPFDTDLRFEAATVLLTQGKPTDARNMLQPVATNPHAGDQRKFAAKVIAEIDGGNAKQALADLAAGPPTVIPIKS